MAFTLDGKGAGVAGSVGLALETAVVGAGAMGDCGAGRVSGPIMSAARSLDCSVEAATGDGAGDAVGRTDAGVGTADRVFVGASSLLGSVVEGCGREASSPAKLGGAGAAEAASMSAGVAVPMFSGKAIGLAVIGFGGPGSVIPAKAISGAGAYWI